MLRTQKCIVCLTLLGGAASWFGAWIAHQSITISQQSADTADRSILLAQKSERDGRLISEKQITQSESALQATIKEFQLDQRAWLAAANPELIMSAGKPGIAKVIITNTGKTPALGFIGKIHWVQLPNSLPLTPFDILYTGKPYAFGGTVFPNQAVVVESGSGGVRLDQPFIDSITNKTLVIYVYGRMDYNDAFGNAHWTEFCYVFDSELKPKSQCWFYNTIDEDKAQQKKLSGAFPRIPK